MEDRAANPVQNQTSEEGQHQSHPHPRRSPRLGLSAWQQPSTTPADQPTRNANGEEVDELQADGNGAIFSRGPTPSFADSQLSIPISPSGYYCANPSHELLVSSAERRHQRAWTRRRGDKPRYLHSKQRRSKNNAVFVASCLSLAIFVALLSTYIALLVTTRSLDTGAHVALILLSVASAVVFLWTLVRSCCIPGGHRSHSSSHSSRVRNHNDRSRSHQESHSQHHRRHHRRRRGNRREGGAQPSPHLRIEPHHPDTLPDDDIVYTPTTPIRVHIAHDELWEKTPEQERPAPTAPVIEEVSDIATSERPREVHIRAPPPAYGLWRCSVRADPNLLHWARSPTEPAATSPGASSWEESSGSSNSGGSSPTEPGSPKDEQPAPSEYSTAPPSYATHPAGERASVHEHPVGGLTPIPEVVETESEVPARPPPQPAVYVPEMLQRPRDCEADAAGDWPLQPAATNAAVMEATRMLLSQGMGADDDRVR